MPIEYTENIVKQFVIKSFTCDCCDTKYDDILDIQEMLYFHNNCGYGSLFGDGNTIELVMCEKCVQEKLGDYIHYREEY